MHVILCLHNPTDPITHTVLPLLLKQRSNHLRRISLHPPPPCTFKLLRINVLVVLHIMSLTRPKLLFRPTALGQRPLVILVANVMYPPILRQHLRHIPKLLGMMQHILQYGRVPTDALILPLLRPHRGILDASLGQHFTLHLELPYDVPRQRRLEGVAQSLVVLEQFHQLVAVPSETPYSILASMMMLRVVAIAVVVVVIALRGIEWRSADDGTAGFDGSREHETGVESGFGNEVALLDDVSERAIAQDFQLPLEDDANEVVGTSLLQDQITLLKDLFLAYPHQLIPIHNIHDIQMLLPKLLQLIAQSIRHESIEQNLTNPVRINRNEE
mmetsp:Transcript_22508/g.34290  ORF Transcript_22508/g.34290 Transcript_22508/m.34290 type:complete len:329 (-) Transcript_22508:586-1572(-)